MKIKETRDSIILTWDADSKKDVDAAINQYYIYIRKGWWPKGEYSHQLTDSSLGTMPRSFFCNYNEIHLADWLSNLLSDSGTNLDEYIHILADWGFSPCLSTRGIGKKAFFRFHVDRARNFWADHRNAHTAAVNAIKLWKRAGRPLFEPLDTGAAPSEEKVVTKLLRLTNISPNFAHKLVGHFHEKLSSKCLDNRNDRLVVARSVIKFINKNIRCAGNWK